MLFTESNFENAIIELLQDQMGYTYFYGPDVTRNYTQPLHMKLFCSSLHDINQSLPNLTIKEAIVEITSFEGSTLVQKNTAFHDMPQNDVKVNSYNDKESRSTRACLLDYDLLLRNNFTVDSQRTIDEHFATLSFQN